MSDKANRCRNVEKEIVAFLYREYRVLKSQLAKSIGTCCPKMGDLDIFHHAQTMSIRILFLAFVEARGCSPEKNLTSVLTLAPLPDLQLSWSDINGLVGAIACSFAKDSGYLENLNNLKISKKICCSVWKIIEYFRRYDADASILGIIFEQSTNDFEELSTNHSDKKTTKRKKDGIFYTPPHITRHIVEQAVGGWLADRRKEIGFAELPQIPDTALDPKQSRKSLKAIEKKSLALHISAWEAYQKALSNIKVLDPACGSGAFLNEVFDYLYSEGQTINNELARLRATPSLFRWDTHILANNIYGVDINRESVEITKLSLWLKTANKNEKLTYLEDNIKCGNSLIDDPNIAGELAFDWQSEFPEIMESGGFDVVVGNPPYVFAREKITAIEKDYYSRHYQSAQYQVNTYLLFIEKSIDLIKKGYGRCSLIVPNAWLMVSSAERLRALLLEQTTICSITNLMGQPFESASVETIILETKKTVADKSHDIKVFFNDDDNNQFVFSHPKLQAEFAKNPGSELKIFAHGSDTDVLKKIKKDCLPLHELYEVKSGLMAYSAGKGRPRQSPEDVKNRIYDFKEKIDDKTHKYLDGKNVGRYWHRWEGAYLRYGDNLAYPSRFEFFSNPVIIVREITGKHPRSLSCTYSDGSETLLFNRSNIAIAARCPENDLRFLLGLINSSLMSYYYMRSTPKSVRKLFPKIILADLKKIPTKSVSAEIQQPVIKAVERMLKHKKELIELSDSFLNLIKLEFDVTKNSRDLKSWHTLEQRAFLTALEKNIKPHTITLAQKSEWLKHFETEKTKAQSLNLQIENLDAEINAMVYVLYGLTQDEIAIVEKG